MQQAKTSTHLFTLWIFLNYTNSPFLHHLKNFESMCWWDGLFSPSTVSFKLLSTGKRLFTISLKFPLHARDVKPSIDPRQYAIGNHSIDKFHYTHCKYFKLQTKVSWTKFHSFAFCYKVESWLKLLQIQKRRTQRTAAKLTSQYILDLKIFFQA